MKKILTAVLSCVLLLGVMSVSSAETLEDRIASLEERVAHLEAIIGKTANGADAGTTDADKTPVEEVHGTVLMDQQQFIKDIAESYNKRSIVATKYTNAEEQAMTTEESVLYYTECANAEKEFFDKYQYAVFNDLNIQYLCGRYIAGLAKQYKALDVWNSAKDFDEFNDQYQSGYYNRAYVIVELTEYYNAPFGDISSMKADTKALDTLNEAEKRNASVDHGTIKKTQQLLNDIGFFCGTADGVSGKRTVKSIKRFQEMYGYEPVDGMIDDELIAQLEAELAKK